MSAGRGSALVSSQEISSITDASVGDCPTDMVDSLSGWTDPSRQVKTTPLVRVCQPDSGNLFDNLLVAFFSVPVIDICEEG